MLSSSEELTALNTVTELLLCLSPLHWMLNVYTHRSACACVCVCYSLVVLFMPAVVVQCYVMELNQNDKVCVLFLFFQSAYSFNYTLWEAEDGSVFHN